MTPGIRLGVVIPQTRRWSELAQDFAWAEDIGYDVAFTYDHLTHPTAAGGWLGDGFSVLAAAAATTSRIGLGTLVASATLHSPVALARLAATTDDIAGGRLVLGLGAGSPRCADADRGESPTPGEMYQRLADVVAGYVAVFDGATEWQGATRSFAGLETTATPPDGKRPQLMLAAHGPRSIDLTVRYADAWNTYGGPAAVALEPEDYWTEVAAQVARVDAACVAAGRDPGSLRRSLLLGYGTVRPTESVAAYTEAAERAVGLGFGELVVYGPGAPGEAFTSDPVVHAEAVSRIRA
ncbi:LLM class flavin-dependent oxidoreductase [Marmoricola sp. RAF53]|uniref:LLM class flavin-dependent oxidoreductase n=1 Tax=Marmoricola sp. RAF53 TaxID=3233059 RepID=UPI003F968EF6